MSAFLTAVFPPLPLPEQSVDFVYGLSVFTHIDDFEEAWLLEISRVLRPGGMAFLTFHSERTWADLANPKHFMRPIFDSQRAVHETIAVNDELFAGPMPLERMVFRSPHQYQHMQTFHRTDYLRRSWGRFFDIKQIVPFGHGMHQDAVVCQKRY